MLRYNSIKRNNFPNIGNEVISSLPLQMSLYFNAFFFPCWFITVVIMWKIKFECLSHIYRVIVTAVLIGVTVIECLRLYVGYLGNLTEKMPELAGFWMLTLLLQMPLQLFLFVNEETLPQPAERAVQAVMLVLLIAELVSGYFALRRASKHQAKRFHLMKFEMSPSHSQHNLSFKED